MINQYEKRIHSQNGEDGVIEHIFNNIGLASKVFVEFGFGMKENNSKNLIEQRGFKGLFIDSDILPGYRNKTIDGVHYHQSWITRSNINEIIGQYYAGDIDFLSVDVDGVDLYLLDVISIVSPRLICTEYCASIGKDLSVTVPYKDDFDRHQEHPSGWYCGASLNANINVMRKKGYAFVGSVAGLNAFFVRNDCELNELQVLTCDEGWQPHKGRTYDKAKRHDGTSRAIPVEEQFNTLKDLKWIEVDAAGNILE